MKKRLKPILSMSGSDIDRFYSKIDTRSPDDCHNWTACISTGGYGLFRVGCYDAMIHAHRVAYMLHHQVELPEDHGKSDTCVLHTCDNRRCCNPAHLWLGSRADNTKDCAAKGRIVTNPDNKPPVGVGEKNGRAILTEDDVRYIRRAHAECPLGTRWTPNNSRTALLERLASQFGLSKTSIRDITGRRSWKHVE